MEDAPSATASSPPAASRFLTLEEITHIPAGKVEGRVTLNAFLVPKGIHSTINPCYKDLREVLGCFQPRGFEFIISQALGFRRYLTTWFWTLAEDGWVERKFGNLEQTQEVICKFHLWSPKWGASPELEEASVTDPQARESWKEEVAKVMPPVMAWVQERWDIRKLPCFDSPSEVDSVG